MKYFWALIISIFCQYSYAQVIVWQETFDPNPLPGWALNIPFGNNDADSNFWVINDNEGGVPAGSCGLANNGNNTLHVTSVLNPLGGAAYDAGGLCGFLFCPLTANKAETPMISTLGNSGLTLSFDYIEAGQGNIDDFSLYYSANGGATWLLLSNPAKTNNLGCGGQGKWTAYSIPLPAICDNNPNVKIAFHWANNDDGIGTDPSVAINDIKITTNITPVNSAPVANNDNYTVSCNGTVTMNVLANDTDSNNNTLSLLGSIPSTVPGTLTQSGNQFVFTPNANYSGTFFFQYVVCDNGTPVLCDSATVVVTVGSCNQPPNAVADNYTVCINSNTSLNVLANDTDPDGNTISISSILIGTAPAIFSTVGNNIQLNPNPGYQGNFSFSYIVCDNATPSLCDTAIVNISVVNCNQPPVAVQDNYTVNCNQSYTFNPILNDTDLEGDPITMNMPLVMNPKSGVITTSGSNLIYTPNNCFTGKDTLFYSITAAGAMDTGMVVLTVLTNCPCNPPIALPDNAATPCNTPVIINPLSNDTDIDGGPLAISVLAGPFHGTISSSTTSITYTPNICYDGLDTIVYKVCDPSNLCDTGIIIVNVNACNCLPPVPEFGATPIEVCAGRCVNFTDLSTNSPTSWQWTFTGGTPSTSTQKNPGPICYNTPGLYSVSLVVSNSQGTAPILTKTNYIKVNPTPPDLTFNISDTLGKLVYLDAVTNGVAYSWSPSAGLSSPNDKIVGHYVIDSYKVYTCTIVNDKGCQGTTTYNISGIKPNSFELGNLIWVPNAFSPNGDMKNDRWEVIHNNLETYECQVFNRWGQKVFETKDPDNSWNGTTTGTDIGTQVFFYIIKAKFKDGSEKILKGDITVLY